MGILEIWLQLIVSNLEVRFSAIWGGGKTKDLVVYVKVNWYPLSSVWDQSSPKLNPTLFAGLPYARNRSLDWDLFCGGSSIKLPSTSHVHKMDSRPGIITYATSHYIYFFLWILELQLYYIYQIKTYTVEFQAKLQTDLDKIVGNFHDHLPNQDWVQSAISFTHNKRRQGFPLFPKWRESYLSPTEFELYEHYLTAIPIFFDDGLLFALSVA